MLSIMLSINYSRCFKLCKAPHQYDCQSIPKLLFTHTQKVCHLKKIKSTGHISPLLPVPIDIETTEKENYPL